MKAAVVVFPGSNCDRDCAVALERSTGCRPTLVWHADSELPDGLDLIVLPGGFSYGDYLRCGAMAAQSPVMRAVVEQARRGVTVGNGEGAFYTDGDTLERLEGEGRIVFRYRDNPNGSLRGVAGLVNEGGNVLGLMPHPDRAFEPELGSADGAILFQSIAASV